jgi:hypothetical protein
VSEATTNVGLAVALPAAFLSGFSSSPDNEPRVASETFCKPCNIPGVLDPDANSMSEYLVVAVMYDTLKELGYTGDAPTK